LAYQNGGGAFLIPYVIILSKFDELYRKILKK
jgi:hypothetical protein